MTLPSLGDFEQLVLLAVLQLEEQARAREIRARIEAAARRKVSRGALYATLDRLEAKGMLEWEVEEAIPARGGIPGRRFRVTKAGLAALRRSYRAVQTLAQGLDRLLGRS
jgi:DNA-binding PadR family transcriptional regulator